MAYRIKRGDRSAQSSLRRIAREQIERATRAADDPATDADDAIHDIRKRCKKIRALLRLVGPHLSVDHDENAAFRAIARPLGAARDADVLVDTFDRIAVHDGAEVQADILAPIRSLLVRRRTVLIERIDTRALLVAARSELLEAQARVAGWRLRASGFDAFGAGVEVGFRRARKAMRKAHADPSAEAFHAWRKRCKDHAYHLRLLRPLWPGPMRAMGACAAELGELLGDHHDLAVLDDTVRDAAGELDAPAVDLMAALIHARQEALARKAFPQGARLFADKPSALAARWRRRYDVWRNGA
ncbi:CHAD domain-containing protein [Luteimonas sp. BDR2-5]|uniref:CHAD domain-containing protein n=1 Tax=Proluteimonas luteida TaxID=2878685 RepID=UPI001E407DD1|nr:CHAD domain-containing protein [Luteimonas sp. BDR2-5]MCD9027891.1 CHAD domain-containing protein [Luteimonas sp. BDR2-5]